MVFTGPNWNYHPSLQNQLKAKTQYPKLAKARSSKQAQLLWRRARASNQKQRANKQRWSKDKLGLRLKVRRKRLSWYLNRTLVVIATKRKPVPMTRALLWTRMKNRVKSQLLLIARVQIWNVSAWCASGRCIRTDWMTIAPSTTMSRPSVLTVIKCPRIRAIMSLICCRICVSFVGQNFILFFYQQ